MEGLLDAHTVRQLIATVAAIVVAILVRFVALRAIRRAERLSLTDRLRWARHARNAVVATMLLALVFVWGEDLRDFLVSLVVLASALVLATRELVMCVMGSVLRATVRGFQVGDRIEVGAVRGDVIDLGWLATTILEIGPGHQRTGRTVVVPNSAFLTQTVANETFTQAYVLHTFLVPLSDPARWREDEAALLAAADEVAKEHAVTASQLMDAEADRHGLPRFDVQARVTIHVEKPGELALRVRIPTPARERGRLEQEVLRRFLARTGPPAEPAPSEGSG